MPINHPEFGSNTLQAVFSRYPRRATATLNLMADVMAPNDALSSQDKELIFSYCSYLNACSYCFDSHKAVAAAYGADAEILQQLAEDIEGADIPAALKQAMKFVKKLTETPSKIVAADISALMEAGYEEQTTIDIVSICCMANFMNRFVNGLGVGASSEEADAIGLAIAKMGYSPSS